MASDDVIGTPASSSSFRANLKRTDDIAVEEEHAAAAESMDDDSGSSVGSRLSALFAKIDHLSATPRTDWTLRQIGSLCVRIAMYSLGGLARPGTRKMDRLLNLTTSPFEDEDVLGYGTRCCVIKVRHRVTGKTLVTKELLVAQEPEAVEVDGMRLLREACFMAACGSHPSLVQFYAVARCPISDQWILVMEHVGLSLYEFYVQKRGGTPFPGRDVRSIIRQVLSGAKAMHDRGIVHGAINPDNVLVSNHNNNLVVKIGGAGQATSTEGNTWYRAPEAVLLTEPAPTAKGADSWSIGCLMADLLLNNKALFEVPATDEKRHLYEIFHVLGFPSEETIEAIKLPNKDPQLAQDVRRRRARQTRMTKHHNNLLRELIHPGLLSDDGFDVLSGLLNCNPNKRLTPAAALQLPWFHNDNGLVRRRHRRRRQPPV